MNEIIAKVITMIILIIILLCIVPWFLMWGWSWAVVPIWGMAPLTFQQAFGFSVLLATIKEGLTKR